MFVVRCSGPIWRFGLDWLRNTESLTDRFAEIERKDWCSEVEGLPIFLVGAHNKLVQIDQRSDRSVTAAPDETLRDQGSKHEHVARLSRHVAPAPTHRQVQRTRGRDKSDLLGPR